VDAIIGLLGALIGAGAALAATFISGRRESRDAQQKEVRLAAAEHVKGLGLASHSVEWLTWKAKFAPSEFSADNLSLYDQEIHALLGPLVGSLAVVAALDLKTFEIFRTLTDELYALDRQVGEIAARYQQQPQQVVAELGSDFARASQYNLRLNRSVADMFAG
jgi:hypothetical protein